MAPYLKKKLLHMLKIRYKFFKSVVKRVWSTINIIGKVWDAKNQKIYITEGTVNNILGNDILAKLWKKASQQQAPRESRREKKE